MEREELLFRRLERHIVAERISSGFLAAGGADVDGFLGFSLSVQNRRKARAGQALENHLEAVFTALGVQYDRGAETENNNKQEDRKSGVAGKSVTVSVDLGGSRRSKQRRSQPTQKV